MSWIIITGTNKGIGKALCESLKNYFKIFAINRTHAENADEEYLADLIEIDKHISSIKQKLSNRQLMGLVLNAGSPGPFDSKDSNYLRNFIDTININLSASVTLVESLRNQISPQGFILHLSSGAAIRAYQGWDAYCTTKSALLMYFRCLSKSCSFSVLSIAPGNVQTEMVEKLMKTPESIMPDVVKFHTLKKENKLLAPNIPAEKITEILTLPHSDRKKYSGKLYDLRSGFIDNMSL